MKKGDVIAKKEAIVPIAVTRSSWLTLAVLRAGGPRGKVICWIVEHANDRGVLLGSCREIAEAAGVSKSIVHRVLVELAQAGIAISLCATSGKGGLYEIKGLPSGSVHEGGRIAA